MSSSSNHEEEESPTSSQEELAAYLEVELDDKSECPPHPGVVSGLCIKCGAEIQDHTRFDICYVRENMRITREEYARLRYQEITDRRKEREELLLKDQKLILIVGLDHALLDSIKKEQLTNAELYLTEAPLPDAINGLCNVDSIGTITKLRPHSDHFFEEAHQIFDIYICATAELEYAREMLELLDNENLLREFRVITRNSNETTLDVTSGRKRIVLIVDVDEKLWSKDVENLILIKRYNFFKSSSNKFQIDSKSFSERHCDESNDQGTLASVLGILLEVHGCFFQKENDELLSQDVRKILQEMRKKILKNCIIAFPTIFPICFHDQNYYLWKMAEKMGAVCIDKFDESLTHVVSDDSWTEIFRTLWLRERPLVKSDWIVESYLRWRKEPEDQYQPEGGGRGGQ